MLMPGVEYQEQVVSEILFLLVPLIILEANFLRKMLVKQHHES